MCHHIMNGGAVEITLVKHFESSYSQKATTKEILVKHKQGLMQHGKAPSVYINCFLQRSRLGTRHG